MSDSVYLSVTLSQLNVLPILIKFGLITLILEKGHRPSFTAITEIHDGGAASKSL